MRKQRCWKVFRFVAPSAILLQITACLGPDPQLFLTTSIANALLANVISFGFNLVFGGLAA